MLAVRLEKELENELNIISQVKNQTKSKVIKDALNHYFESIKKDGFSKTPYELGKNLFGLYGSGDGTLSSSYKSRLKEKLYAKNDSR